MGGVWLANLDWFCISIPQKSLAPRLTRLLAVALQPQFGPFSPYSTLLLAPQGPIGGPLKLRDAHRFNVLAVCNVAIYSSLVLVCLHDGLEMDDAFIYIHCLTFSDLDGTPRNYNLPKLSKYRMIDIRAKCR